MGARYYTARSTPSPQRLEHICFQNSNTMIADTNEMRFQPRDHEYHTLSGPKSPLRALIREDEGCSHTRARVNDVRI